MDRFAWSQATVQHRRVYRRRDLTSPREWPLPFSGGVGPCLDGRVGGTPPDGQIAANSEGGESLWTDSPGHRPRSNTGEFTVGELARVCAELAGRLHDDRSPRCRTTPSPPALKIQ